MRRLLTAAIVCVALLSSAVPATAGRMEQQAYGSPVLGHRSLVSTCVEEPPLDSCVVFTLRPGESQVMVNVTDATGMPVFATVGQDVNLDGVDDLWMDFCGATTMPFEPVEPPIGPYEIRVHPHLAPALDDESNHLCTGVGTSGVVTIHINP